MTELEQAVVAEVEENMKELANNLVELENRAKQLEAVGQNSWAKELREMAIEIDKLSQQIAKHVLDNRLDMAIVLFNSAGAMDSDTNSLLFETDEVLEEFTLPVTGCVFPNE